MKLTTIRHTMMEDDHIRKIVSDSSHQEISLDFSSKMDTSNQSRIITLVSFLQLYTKMLKLILVISPIAKNIVQGKWNHVKRSLEWNLRTSRSSTQTLRQMSLRHHINLTFVAYNLAMGRKL